MEGLGAVGLHLPLAGIILEDLRREQAPALQDPTCGFLWQRCRAGLRPPLTRKTFPSHVPKAPSDEKDFPVPRAKGPL